MKIKALFLGLFFLSPILSWSQPYEITEVDIFSLKKPISAKDITVCGINIENSIYEILNKLGKNKSDLFKYVGYDILHIEPGFQINTADKKTIKSIYLHSKFREKLKGKTAGLFNLETSEDVAKYIKSYFGEPDHKRYNRLEDSGYEHNVYYYYSGFKFNWNLYSNKKPPELSIWFELISDEELEALKNPPISDDWEVLKDIDELEVVIEILSLDALKIGLTQDRLETVVELKLRRERIKIIESPLMPYLYINVNVARNAFNINLELKETVKIQRLNRIAYGNTTWRVGTTGGHADKPEYIVSALSRLLDDFLNAYYKANPKK